MNEFLIELQAKLDEVKSKGLINSDIDKIQGQLNKLKLQAEIDPNTISNLVKQLESIINQKITISNININQGSVVKEAQKTGQQIGSALNQGIKQTSSLDSVIDKQVKQLMSEYSIIGEKGSNAFEQIKQAILNYKKELSTVTSSGNDIFDIFGNSANINNITSALAENMKVADTTKSVYADLLEYIKQINSSGTKIHLPQSIKAEYGDMFLSMRNSLGAAFTTGKGTDFETFVTELNSQLGNTIDMSHGAEHAFEDLVNKVKSAKGSSYLSGNNLLNSGLVDVTEMESRISSVISNIESEEKRLAQASTSSTDMVIQNEGKKQQAIQETAQIQKQLIEAGNIIQRTDFATSFGSKDAAEEYFNTISKTVSVQEKLGENKNLESFIVETKNAKGAVEKLTFKYNELTKKFEYTGGSINNNGVIKQINAISAKADSLQTKLDKLKSNYSDVNTSRPIKDSNNISALSTQYDKVSQAIENVRNADNSTFSSMVSNAQREIAVLESMVAQFRNTENVATQMKSVDISSGIAQAQERLGKLKANSTGFEQMTQTIRELDTAIANVGDKSSLDSFIDRIRVAETQLTRVKAEANSMAKINKIQFQIETNGYESKIESLISRTRQWTDEAGNARISTKELSSAFDNLKAASNTLSNNNTVANQKALITAEKELDAQIKKVTSSIKIMNAQYAKDSTIASLHQKIQEFYDKNGAAHRKWGVQLKQMLAETASGATLTNQKVREIESSFIQVGNAARSAGRLGKSWFQTLREGMQSFSYWTSSTFLVMKGIQSIKGGLSTVKALDTALVDLKKTTTMTNSELEKFYYDSNKVAKQMGVTTEEIIKQAAAWSRLGFSSKDMATKMAKYSSMFASISPGLNLDSATDGLVSTMKAFSIGLDNADEVVDGIMSKINIIGNSKALNNSDIVDFLTRSSSALASANNSIEESIAMGEAIVEITRDAAGAGQVMKTTSMRIRGYDEELESYTEDLENLKGEIADLTKTAKTPGGISLFTDETKETYKSTYKILEEISEIWNDLTDKNQANNICLYVQKCA